jgi:uncharacterized membrane protein
MKKRLHFIDAIRAFAILMMLQGHFIGLSFKEFDALASLKRSTGTSGSLLFDGWYFMKGLTAPLFFFVTGLVFVFLLLQSHHPEKRNPRVKKGLIRGFELIFWGYLLQLNLRYFTSTFYSETPIIYAFHVLQCIGVSILILIGLYLLYKSIKKIPLFLYYLVAGIFFFGVYSSLKKLASFPANSPQLLQNIFKGPHAIFPLIPWAGFVLFGGVFGVIVHTLKKKFTRIPLSIALLVIAFGLKYISYEHGAVWLYNRLGEVLIVTVVFIQLENWFSKRWKLFLSVGQKTLFIYLWHTIVLYGGIVGFGLTNFIKKQLTATEAIFGALLFLFGFVYFSKLSPFFDALKAKVFKFLKLPAS